MNGLLWGFFAITVIVWALAMVLIGLIFSMAANERRREMAVLRAVGATRNFIFRSVLTEAALLALAGAVIGIAVAASGSLSFQRYDRWVPEDALPVSFDSVLYRSCSAPGWPWLSLPSPWQP